MVATITKRGELVETNLQARSNQKAPLPQIQVFETPVNLKLTRYTGRVKRVLVIAAPWIYHPIMNQAGVSSLHLHEHKIQNFHPHKA